MSNKKIEKMQKEYTKPQLSRWEQQKKRQRIILISGIALIAVIILGLVGTYIWQEVAPLYKTIAIVNGEKITMNDYVKALRSSAEGASQTEIFQIAYNTQNQLIQGILVGQKAAELNITVTDDEVNKYLESIGKNADYAKLARAQLLSEKLFKDYFIPQVPATADQRNIDAMFLADDAQAAEIRARVEAGENFSDLAAEYSLDNYTKSVKGIIGMHPQSIVDYYLGSSIPGEYAFSSDAGSLSQPRPDEDKQKNVGYWLIMVIEKGTGDLEGQVNVRAMLLGSEAEANQIRADIIANGKDFGTIADEKSQYNTGGQNGGLIGMIKTDEAGLSKEFVEAAFSLDINEISQPVRDISETTKGGSWLIRVNEVAPEKELTQNDINVLAYSTFNNWMTVAMSTAEVDDRLTPEDFNFAYEKVIGK